MLLRAGYQFPPIEVGPTSNSRDVLTAVEEGHGRKCERVQALVGGHLVSDLGLEMSLFLTLSKSSGVYRHPTAQVRLSEKAANFGDFNSRRAGSAPHSLALSHI